MTTKRCEGATTLEARPDIGLGRIPKAFGYALAGLAEAWRTEAAFRQEALVAAVLLPLACWIDVPLLQRLALVASVLLVLMVELVNCSIESAIDRISLERHALSKRAKDTGSAAVLIAILVALAVWGAVLASRLFAAFAR